MSYSTDKWFQYLNEDVRTLEEGLRDIGLSEQVINYIESSLHSASENAKTWMGHMWKKTFLHEFVRPSNRLQKFRFDTMEPLLSVLDYWTGGAKEDDIDPPLPKVEFESLLREGEEWTAEKAQRTKFVLKNINTVLKDQPLGKWSKAFKKALKNLTKLGINSETTEFIKTVLDNATEQAWKQFQSRFNDVFVLLNLHPDNIRLIQKNNSMQRADEIAEEELRNQEDPEQVLHTFDDGSYWYDLDTGSCDIEGERMGHCGAGQSGGTLFSLRKPEGKRGKSKSFVTLEMGDGNQGETLYQIKGKENSVPPEETWPHIEWFVDNMNIQAIEEQGEYSANPEDFAEMNFWLEKRTGVQISGNRESREEEIRNELDNADYEFQGMDFCEVYWEISDYDGDGSEIYVELGAECTIEVNLGWPGFRDKGEGYFATSAEGVPIDGIDYIPIKYSEVNQFESEVGIDNILSMLPGEDKDIEEIKVEMKEGVDPSWREGEPIEDTPATAHLIIRLRTRETVGEDSPVNDFNYFASEIRDEFEEKYSEHVRDLQAGLADNGYMTKNVYLQNREGFLELEQELKYWSVYSDNSETKFTFQYDDGEGSATSQIPTGVSIPTQTLIYLTDNQRNSAETLVADIFKIRGRREVRSSNLNSQMAMHLDNAYAESQRAGRAASRQQEFEFGPEYEPEDYLEFPKDINLVLYPKIRYEPREPARVPSVTFRFLFQININYGDSIEEIDSALNLVKYLNEKPELVVEAAQSIVSIALEPLEGEVAIKLKYLEDEELANHFFRGMDGVYGAAADSGQDDDAERRMLIAMWIRESWPDMDHLQRLVALRHYIDPMNGRTFRLHSNLGAIDPDTGKPRMWDDLIQSERVRRGVAMASSAAPANESIEEQIHRIAAMVSEVDKSYDLRIYKITVGCNVSHDLGGTEAETAAEIRGVDGVTTVRPLADLKKRISPQSEYIPFELKFELVGAQSRVAYRDRVLFPGIRKIKGVNIVDWTSVHRTNVQGTVRTVRENKQLSEYGFGAGAGSSMGGVAQNLGSVRFPKSPGRQTPQDTLQTVVDDWAHSSIMAYDYPTNTNDMRYHVMMPVDQLWKYRSRFSRHPMDVFDAKHQQFDAVYQRLKDKLEDPEAYHEFISQGAQGPVYVAIGKNGRVKITGNEDLVWFAKKSGLQEVPVFLSYQRQV
jgi:hypothetical protein